MKNKIIGFTGILLLLFVHIAFAITYPGALVLDKISEYKGSSVYVMPVHFPYVVEASEGAKAATEQRIIESKPAFFEVVSAQLRRCGFTQENEFVSVINSKDGARIEGFEGRDAADFVKTYDNFLDQSDRIVREAKFHKVSGKPKIDLSSRAFSDRLKNSRLALFLYASVHAREPGYLIGGPLVHLPQPVHNIGDAAGQILGQALMDTVHKGAQPEDSVNLRVALVDAKSGEILYSYAYKGSLKKPFDSASWKPAAMLIFFPLRELLPDVTNSAPNSGDT